MSRGTTRLSNISKDWDPPLNSQQGHKPQIFGVPPPAATAPSSSQGASLTAVPSGDLEVTVDFLTEVDKLVQLIECPIFTCEARDHLLEFAQGGWEAGPAARARPLPAPSWLRE